MKSGVGKRWPRVFRTGQESKTSALGQRRPEQQQLVLWAATCHLGISIQSIPLKLSAYEAAGPVLGTEDIAMNKRHRS